MPSFWEAELAACKALAKRKTGSIPLFFPWMQSRDVYGVRSGTWLEERCAAGLRAIHKHGQNAAPEDARGASRTLLAFKLIRRIGRAARPAVSRPTKGAKSINRHPIKTHGRAPEADTHATPRHVHNGTTYARTRGRAPA